MTTEKPSYMLELFGDDTGTIHPYLGGRAVVRMTPAQGKQLRLLIALWLAERATPAATSAER